MKKFKVSVSKGGKKYSLILNDINEIIARERVHKEGYSILGIEEITGDEIIGHKYVFEAEKDGEIKKGKIVGNDIFKVYLKLRKDLGYSVKLLYTEDERDISDEKKKKIIEELQEEYSIFIGGKKTKGQQLKEEVEENRKNKKELDNFYLKKELEDTYKLIDFVLQKIKNIIDGNEIKDLGLEQGEKIRELYNSIIKLKKTTNIAKLKEVGELALVKVGELELKKLEADRSNDTRGLLKETNKLLKKIGSKEQFIEKERDISFILSNFFSDIFSYFKIFIKKSQTPKKESLDQSSYSYIKNERLLKKYKEKLHLNTKEILKNIFSSKAREKLFLRRSVIQQNIVLLTAKKKGVSFSYTLVTKGYKKFGQSLTQIFSLLKQYIFIILVFYLFSFLFYINYSFYYDFDFFNYKGIFYFLVLNILYFVFSLSRGFLLAFLNFSFLLFSILFYFVNF